MKKRKRNDKYQVTAMLSVWKHEFKATAYKKMNNCFVFASWN